MTALQLHIDGFEDLLRRVVREELARDRDGWLDADASAEYLGIAKRTLHNIVSSGDLPRHGNRGAALKFRRADLDAYMESRRAG